MKVKTSITLSQDVIEAIDDRSAEYSSRSEFIERAVCSYLTHLAKEERDAADLEILNREADRLNREATAVLAFQAEL